MKKYFLILLFGSVTVLAQDQKLGFGCLGLVGGYAGYEYQKYQATGLNSFIDDFNLANADSLSQPMDHFKELKGYRFGINFFRKNYSGFIFTVKGFYQTLLEKKDATVLSSNLSINHGLELKLNQFAIGIDLGTSLSNSFDWKVIDAAVLISTTKFNYSINTPGKPTQKLEYTSDGSSIGYLFGSGFVFHLVKNYISIEGSVGYAYFNVDKVKLDTGEFLYSGNDPTKVVTKFIQNGGLNATIQLNIGFPL